MTHEGLGARKGRKIRSPSGLAADRRHLATGPKIEALEESSGFDRRYALKMAELYGLTGASATAADPVR